MSVDILIFSNMNVARVLFGRKTINRGTLELCERRHSRRHEMAPIKNWFAQIFQHVKKRSLQDETEERKKEIHPIGKETRSALLNLGSLLKKSMEERGQLIGAVIGQSIGTLFCIDFGDMEL